MASSVIVALLVVGLVVVLLVAAGRAWLALYWREVLARLPLPMLALAASYGVYRYALLFVPPWVAVVQAAAFELTYIGLAVARVDQQQRRRAAAISIGAVLTSIIYNSLSGFFHTYPLALVDLGWFVWALLSVVHGAPLAWVAYLVASLLLHSGAPVAPAGAPLPVISALVTPREALPFDETPPLDRAVALVLDEGYEVMDAVRATGAPESTLRRRVRAVKGQG